MTDNDTTVVATPEDAAITTDATQVAASGSDALAIAQGKLEKALSEVKSLRSAKNTLREQATEAEARALQAERIAAEAEEARAQAQRLEAELRRERLATAIGKLGTKVADPELVSRLIETEKITWSDDAQPTNLDELVGKVIERHPVLGNRTLPVGTVTAPSLRDEAPRSVEDLTGMSGNELLNAVRSLARRNR